MTTSGEQALTPPELEGIYRRNFALFLADGILFTVAMGILGTTTVIPDFIRHLTDSEILIGFSGSMFETGWMMPQLFMARYLVRVSHKKWWFVGPNLAVRFALLAFAGIVFLVGGERTGLILALFLLTYGIAAVGDGLAGVPWVDLIGSSLDNRWRARMFGLTTAISGVIMLGIAGVVGLILSNKGPGFPNNYALLFAIAGTLFALSIPLGVFLHELPGGKATETIPTFREFIPALGRVLREDRPYRAMIITRMLSSLFTMAGPFYIGFATVQLGLSSGVAVRNLLAMQTIGSLVGAVAYSWLGNRHNLAYLRGGLLLAAVLPISALLASVVGPPPLYVGFFAAGFALTNLFSCYLNWVIMHASHDQRPVYTGLFNTVSAFTLLTAPIIGGTIAQTVGYEAVFSVALVMVLTAFFVVMRYVHAPRRASEEEA